MAGLLWQTLLIFSIPGSTSRPCPSRLLAGQRSSRLLAAEFVFDVQPVAADRAPVVDARVAHARGGPVPADACGLASHRGLRGAERIVVAEAGAHRSRAANRAGAGTDRRRRALARAVGAKADPAGFDGAEFAAVADADVALRVVAQHPAALQHAEVLLRPAVGR